MSLNVTANPNSDRYKATAATQTPVEQAAACNACLIGFVVLLLGALPLAAAGCRTAACLWLGLILIDCQPLLATRWLGSTTNFAFGWIAASSVRIPTGLILSKWLSIDSSGVVLPGVYLTTLLISAVLAAYVISRSHATIEQQGSDR